MQLHGLLPTAPARIQLIGPMTYTCLVQSICTNTLLPSNPRSIQICMLHTDMHMHTWSRSGRALILGGLCATLDYFKCAWRCVVSADSNHLPALLRVKPCLSLTGYLVICLRLCVFQGSGLSLVATVHVACRFLLVSIRSASIPVCVKLSRRRFLGSLNEQ